MSLTSGMPLGATICKAVAEPTREALRTDALQPGLASHADPAGSTGSARRGGPRHLGPAPAAATAEGADSRVQVQAWLAGAL